jgi:hypothetical protein
MAVDSRPMFYFIDKKECHANHHHTDISEEGDSTNK